MEARAAYFLGSERIKIKKVHVRELDDKEVLIKIKNTGICGSDIDFYLYHNNRNGRLLNKIYTYIHSDPQIIGHEFSGVVEKIGASVENIHVGDHVTGWPIQPCYKCSTCLSGYENLCPFQETWPGTFADYIILNKNNVIPISNSTSFEWGTMVEPLACAIHAIKYVDKNIKKTIMIMGTGSIGLLITRLLSLEGHNFILGVDIDDNKLKVAKEYGANETINIKQNIYDQKILTPDIIFECTGKADAFKNSLKFINNGGKIIVVGSHQKTFPLILSQIRHREIQIIGSEGSQKNDMILAEKLIKENSINLDKIITHKYRLDQINEAFQVASNKTKRVAIKIMVSL